MDQSAGTPGAIGVIGGSGLYEVFAGGEHPVEQVEVATPFGAPSDVYQVTELAGRKVVFLPRHGRGHRISPTHINYRANIWGMKHLGVTQIMSVSAVGSMKEALAPGHFVVVDQFFDRTKYRTHSFFDEGVAAHVAFGDPVCPDLSDAVYRAAQRAGAKVQKGGTYICIEGPQFSTRAESEIYRKWGVDVIGMTNLPEARLAREAELGYATLAMVTDYDCWYEGHDDVTVEQVIETLTNNVALAREVVKLAVEEAPAGPSAMCRDALKHAVMTRPEAIPAERWRQLELLIGRHLKQPGPGELDR